VAVEGVDIVHDLEDMPWPLADEACLSVIGPHVIEHIKPGLTITFFDELWRVLEPGGDAAFVTPFAGPLGFWQDPPQCP